MPTSSKWKDLPTEAIHPASLAMDTASTKELLNLMVTEDRKVVNAVSKERSRIETAAELIVSKLQKSGRVFLVGTGTSGRLGVLEAAEMIATFSTPPTLVRAIMPGGRSGFFHDKEGSEDNFEEGALAIRKLNPKRRDILIGISASGMTQFVRGALSKARQNGVAIIFITCWPGTELQTFVDVLIAPAVGPEVIAGSTRLKAGIATKLVLNMLTTVSMVKIGKTYGNLMVDLKAGSEKACDRARRIVTMATGLNHEEAGALLRRARWNVKVAIVMQKTGKTYSRAMSQLKRFGDSVRSAIGEDFHRNFKTRKGQ